MMILQGIDGHPKGLVVAQSRRRKDDVILPLDRLFGNRISGWIQDAKPAFDFLFCFGRYRVGCLGSDDMGQFKSLLVGKFPTGLGHDIGSLFLLVDFTAVSDRRDGMKIPNPYRAVVHGPEFLLEPIGFERFGLEDFQKIGGLGKASTWSGCKPSIWIVDGQVPSRSASHRKAPDRNALGIDRVLALGMLKGFERIDFTCKLVGVAVASEGMDHQNACVR